MSERDDFLAWVESALYEAELALHHGDAAAQNTPRPPSTDSRAATPCEPPSCIAAKAANGGLPIAMPTL